MYVWNEMLTRAQALLICAVLVGTYESTYAIKYVLCTENPHVGAVVAQTEFGSGHKKAPTTLFIYNEAVCK